MLNALQRQHVSGIALGTEKFDPTVSDADKLAFREKEALLVEMIIGSINPMLQMELSLQATGEEMWAELLSKFEGTKNVQVAAQRAHAVRGELQAMQMHAGTDVDLHLFNMFRPYEESKTLGETISDSFMRELLLNSLPTTRAFNQLRTKVYFSQKITKNAPVVLREMIRTTGSRSKQFEHAMNQRANTGGGGRGRGGGGNRAPQAATPQGGAKTTAAAAKDKSTKSLEDIVCFRCH